MVLLGKSTFYFFKKTKCALDGRCEISNNRAERSIKPFVIGRKNFLFADTVKGARASSIIYSIVETAKENGLNPMNYLVHLFERIPNLNFRGDTTVLESLFPWSKLPDQCYINKSRGK